MAEFLRPHPMTFINKNKNYHAPCVLRTKLAQLRANKSPLSQSYQHTVNPDTYTSQSQLCLETHMTPITPLSVAI